MGLRSLSSMAIRFAVHVQAGATQSKVGGMRAGSLLVRVREPAIEDKANEAVVAAIASAFGVKPRSVRLVHGRRSRRKLLDVDLDSAQGATRLADLQAG